jgi:hypothetical protein
MINRFRMIVLEGLKHIDVEGLSQMGGVGWKLVKHDFCFPAKVLKRYSHVRTKSIDYEHCSCPNSLMFDMFNEMLQPIHCQVVIAVSGFAGTNESVAVQVVEAPFM